MSEDKLDDILSKDVLSWQEYIWLTENLEGNEITSKQFKCPKCNDEYTIILRHLLDGQQPDSTNTRAYIVSGKK